MTNRCMNSLISNKTGFETESIKTWNAGKHTMSTRLAEIFAYASGYAVESQEMVFIFEMSGGFLPMGHRTAAKHDIEIFQTETMNTNLHDEKGGQHLLVVTLLLGLGAVYHSLLCQDETKEMMINELLRNYATKPTAEPPKPWLIAPLKCIGLNKLPDITAEHRGTCSALGEEQ